MQTVKTLIRLSGCPGWPEFSLGAQVILLVLSCSNSFAFGSKSLASPPPPPHPSRYCPLYFLINQFCWCIDSAYVGESTHTTAFAETIWYFAYTIKTLWIFAWRSLIPKKLFLTKWQLCEFSHVFLFALKQRFCLCLDSTYMGTSTCTSAFTEAFWYFRYTIQIYWACSCRDIMQKKKLAKWMLIKLLIAILYDLCIYGEINLYHSFFFNSVRVIALCIS